MSSLLPNIDGLSVEERLKLIEDLWESLRATPGALPLIDEQRAELDRRLDDLEADATSPGIPWLDVLRSIRERNQ